MLTHQGHAVIECQDGLSTLARLEREPCDAVISDVLMPQMDGYRLCYGEGFCGTAVFRRAPVLVSDIAADPLWKDWRELATTKRRKTI